MQKAGGGKQWRRFSLPAGLKLSSACETLLQVIPTSRAMSIASKAPNIRMHRALVISSCLSEAEDFQRHLPYVKYPDVQFIYPHDIGNDVMPHDTLLTACKEMIKDEDVDMLVCIHPHLMFVHASLLVQYSHLRGPSFESIFLCSHRYYCRKYITRGLCNDYNVVELDGFTASQVNSLIGDFTLPVKFMEALNCTSRPLTMLLHKCKALKRDLDEIKAQVGDNLKELSPFIAKNIDDIYYDQALELMCLLEKVKPHYRTSKSDHEDTGLYVVECCVSDGEVIPWVISDINYWTDRPHCKKSVTIPTTMGASTQFEVWAVVREILEKLMSFGFKNSFVNVTLQVNSDGSVRIHDIFPGCVYDNLPLSRFVYQNGDSLRAQCDVSSGQEPNHVKIRPRHVAMKAYITLFGSGALGDLVDLEELKSNKHVTLSVTDDVVIQMLTAPSRTGLSVSDASRTPRSSVSSLEFDHSKLTTPETGRSRQTTPDLTTIAEINQSREPTMHTESGENDGAMSKSGNVSPVDKPLDDVQPDCTSEGNGTENKEQPTPPNTAMRHTPPPGGKQASGEIITTKISSVRNESVPALVFEPDEDKNTIHASEMASEDDEMESSRPVIIADSDIGVCIGQIYIFGSTIDDCTKQLSDILEVAVKRKEDCPWLANWH